MGWLKEVIPEDLARMMRGGKFYRFPTNSGWTEADVGTGTTTQTISILYGTAGASANGSGLFTANFWGGNIGNTIVERFRWDKQLWLGFFAGRKTSVANSTAYVQLKEASTIGQLGQTGIGIAIANLTVVGESYGSERGTTATIKTLSSGEVTQFAICLTPGSRIDYYVNGALTESQTTAAQIPASAEGAATIYLAASMATAATAGDALFGVGNIWAWQKY